MQVKVASPAKSQQQNATRQDHPAKETQAIFTDSRPELAQLKATQALMAASPHNQNLLTAQAMMASSAGSQNLARGQKWVAEGKHSKSPLGSPTLLQANPPRSSSIQKKAINGLSVGQAVAEDNDVWIGDGKTTSKRYWSVAAGNAGSRAELLQSIAALGGTLGHEVDGKVQNKWNFSPDLLGKASDFYDPLMVRISGTYSGRTLAVDYHFGSGFAGYIIRVDDNGDVKTMVGQGEEVDENTYSNVHDVGKDAGALAGGSADAITKVTGEGARWQAVRNAASYIQDSSRFYTNENAGGTLTTNVRHVTFPVLWKSWDATFGKGYNITDARIVKALKNENLRVTTAQGVVDSKVGSCASTGMTQGKDICVDPVKPKSQAELGTKTIAFYRFTLAEPISGARGKSYEEQVDAITNSVTSLVGVTYRDIGGCTGLNTFEYLLEVNGAAPVLAGAACQRIGAAISYPQYRDGQVPDLAPKTHSPDLDNGEAEFLEARTRIYNGTLKEALRRLESDPLDRQDEVDLGKLTNGKLLVWDGEPETDVPSVDELMDEIGELLATELQRLDEIAAQVSEEDDDEVIEQPTTGKGGKGGKPGKGGKGGKPGKGGK